MGDQITPELMAEKLDLLTKQMSLLQSRVEQLEKTSRVDVDPPEGIEWGRT